MKTLPQHGGRLTKERRQPANHKQNGVEFAFRLRDGLAGKREIAQNRKPDKKIPLSTHRFISENLEPYASPEFCRDQHDQRQKHKRPRQVRWPEVSPVLTIEDIVPQRNQEAQEGQE